RFYIATLLVRLGSLFMEDLHKAKNCSLTKGFGSIAEFTLFATRTNAFAGVPAVDDREQSSERGSGD
ncbi:hypothetical protein U1Q18_052276, partial [Sarracenia purpurea var. burkii]